MTNAVATEVVETVETVEDAPVAQADSKYAADDVATDVASRLIAARQAGWSRTKLQELTELTPAQLWRCEQGKINKSEVDQVLEALAKIESGELVAPVRKGKIGKVQSKINSALAILVPAAETDKITKAGLVDAIRQAVDALNATDEPVEGDADAE